MLAVHTNGAPHTVVPTGTAAYMSPEQAKGEAPDKRSDIWSFGVILYEFLTDKRLYPGETATEVLVAILSKEPDMSTVPARVRRLLRWCLEKDPKLRLASISDARTLLDEDVAPAPVAVKAPPVTKHPLVWSLASLAALLFVFALWNRPVAAPPIEARLSIPLPLGQEVADAPAISPDGRTIAYDTQAGLEEPQLYLRDLNSFDVRMVQGSNGAQKPFFSPDGKSVGFFAQGQLQKAEIAGGMPIRIAEAPSPYGGTWSEDNSIIYAASLGSGLLRVAATGGTPESLSKPDGAGKGYAHVFPQALPGAHSLLFTIWGQTPGGAVFSLDSKRWDMVLPGRTGASIFTHNSSRSAGYLLQADDAAEIKAALFDAAHPAHISADTPVLAGVYSAESDPPAWLAVSNTGTAVYAVGNPGKRSLAWVDQDGKIDPLPKNQDVYAEVALSPDGTKAVVRHGADLKIHDLLRGTSSRLTSGDAGSLQPVWSADGTRIIFALNRGGDWDIYSQLADASQPAQSMLKLPNDQFPLSMLPDGTLLYSEIHPKTGSDLWTLAPDGTMTPLRVTPASERDGQFSPGPEGAKRWVAYASDESGRSEIYVQSYPSGDNRVAVSTGGGTLPRWSHDGKDLYYVSGDALMDAPARPDGTFGPSRKVFDRSPFLLQFHSYDVSPDGKRFLMIQRDAGSVPRQLNVILNWSDELDRLLPGK